MDKTFTDKRINVSMLMNCNERTTKFLSKENNIKEAT